MICGLFMLNYVSENRSYGRAAISAVHTKFAGFVLQLYLKRYHLRTASRALPRRENYRMFAFHVYHKNDPKCH